MTQHETYNDRQFHAWTWNDAKLKGNKSESFVRPTCIWAQRAVNTGILGLTARQTHM